jgi:hypothetical protein
LNPLHPLCPEEQEVIDIDKITRVNSAIKIPFILVSFRLFDKDTKIFQYINPDAVDFGAVQGTRPVLYDAINTNNWWLRKTHPSGEIVLVDSGSILNRTTYTPTLNGQIFSEWIMSTYVRDMYVNGVYANTSGFPKANPYIDGFFWDQPSPQASKHSCRAANQ